MKLSNNNKIDIEKSIIYKFLLGRIKVKLSKSASNNSIIIGKMNLKKLYIEIIGNRNTLTIEKDCELRDVCIILSGDNNKISIGKETFINQAVIHASMGSKISIGKGCLFSTDIDIRSHDGHYIYQDGIWCNQPLDVFIGNHVWIGKRVSILKGSVIPNGCVVGQDSLTNKKYKEKNCVLVGTPARIVKRNIKWLRNNKN